VVGKVTFVPVACSGAWGEVAPWQMLQDGSDGTWQYWRKQGMCFWFIEVIDYKEHLSEKEWRENPSFDEGLFEATLKLVDLSEVPSEKIAEALRSCGRDDIEELEDDQKLLWSAEALASYGTYARMGTWQNTRMVTARAPAREECDRLMNDDAYYEEQMERPVNALGSTAREFARGDLWSSLQRIKDNPDATLEQKITLKMYQSAERTLGGEKIPDSLKEAP
jgi:hypothetical protein